MKWKPFAGKFFRQSDGKLPIICILGCGTFDLVTPRCEDHEEKRLDCRCYPSDSKLEEILIQDKPQVIITAGNRSSFSNLAKAPHEVRRKWIHYDILPDLAQLGIGAYNRYLGNVLSDPLLDDFPLVSVFTPTYRTGVKISKPFLSLLEQTYTNWEWIVVDDSDDRGETFALLKRLAKQDHRVHVFKPWEHSGVIGKVKSWACSLARGRFLVELDHDDAFTDYALDCVVRGFRQFPDAGFLYTHCAEIYENGASNMYRNGWAFGYGSYSDVEYRGKLYKSGCAGNINAKTIRHIVSCPNHVRAWRRPVYESIGGHNRELHVADDYELMVRTFLNTRMIRIPRLCYLQYIGDSTQRARSGDIHRHVRSIRTHYDKRIHERLLELGCEDFAWDEREGCFNHQLPNPEVESHATLIADV